MADCIFGEHSTFTDNLLCAAIHKVVTSVPLQEAIPEEVYETNCLRTGGNRSYKPANHELDWADFQTRDPEAIVRP